MTKMLGSASVGKGFNLQISSEIKGIGNKKHNNSFRKGER